MTRYEIDSRASEICNLIYAGLIGRASSLLAAMFSELQAKPTVIPGSPFLPSRVYEESDIWRAVGAERERCARTAEICMTDKPTPCNTDGILEAGRIATKNAVTEIAKAIRNGQ